MLRKIQKNNTHTHNLPSVGHCGFLQVDIADWENTLWTGEGAETLMSVTGICFNSPATYTVENVLFLTSLPISLWDVPSGVSDHGRSTTLSVRGERPIIWAAWSNQSPLITAWGPPHTVFLPLKVTRASQLSWLWTVHISVTEAATKLVFEDGDVGLGL